METKKADLNAEYEREVERYRSQRIVLKALMEVKDDAQKIDPQTVQSINMIYLANELRLNRDEVGSLFGKSHKLWTNLSDGIEFLLSFWFSSSGTKLTSKPLESWQKAKLMKQLLPEIAAQCNDVNSFVRKIKDEEKCNVFRRESVENEIQILLTKYNDQLVELIKLKEKLHSRELAALRLKTGTQQRTQLEMFRLEVKRKIVDIE